MITEDMISQHEFDKIVATTIAVWAGYAKLDNMELVVIDKSF